MTKPLSMPRKCEAPTCENPLNGKRVDAKYCSGACKLAAYHARKGTTTKRLHDHSVCQREGCEKHIPSNLRADARYCSNACRQKVWHDANKDRAAKKREEQRLKRLAQKQERTKKEAVDDFIRELMG